MDRGLVAAGLACIVLAITASTPSGSFASTSAGSAQVYPLPARVVAALIDAPHEAAVLGLINQERVAEGRAPLMPDATIQGAARAHGREMFASGYLTHLSRDGRTPRERVLALGLQVRIVGENLAYAADAQAAHNALLASEPHRRNILAPEYRLIGVAVVSGGSDGVIVVEDFSDEDLARRLGPAAGAVRRSGNHEQGPSLSR